MSFQRPPVVRGVKTRDMVRACMGGREDDAAIAKLAERLNMGDLLDREINYGFSGGEIKRSELLQLLAQMPDLVLLDEPESGVDLVNIALIGQMINELLQKEHETQSDPGRPDHHPHRPYPGLCQRHQGLCAAQRGCHLRTRCPRVPRQHQEEGLRGMRQMSKVVRSSKSRELAEKALDKKAALGEDIDLAKYSSTAEEHVLPGRSRPSFPHEDKAQLMKVGVTLDDASQRSGTFVQMDRSVVHTSASEEGVEVMAITKALEKYDWLQDYWWQAVSVDQDKFTAQAEIDLQNGYFIRALPGPR